MPVLYRKYRPQTFDAVVGQEHVTRTLGAAIAAGRVAHAYLFSGPRGIGKTTMARLLAKAVNCRSGGQGSEVRGRKERTVPCDACDRCREIAEGRCVDVVEMDAASHTQVEKVREGIIEHVRVAPAVAARRVFIIDEVHMLSASSFNALLKTLEEPPSHALFILATTELHKVPDTIRSRCQHFAFRRIGTDDLTARLRSLAKAEGVAVDDEVLAAVVRTADGSLRDAESLLGQLFALGGDRVTADDAALVLPRSSAAQVRALLAAIAQGDAGAAVAAISAADAEGCDAEAFVRDAIVELRATVHAAAAARTPLVPAHVLGLRAFAELADRVGRSDRPFFLIEVAALSLIARAVPTANEVRGNVSASLVRPSTPEPSASNHDDGAPPIAPPASAAEASPTRAKARSSTRDGTVPRADVHAVDGAEQSAQEALSNIQAAWRGIVRALAATNPSLPYLLEGGRPQHVAGGVCTIGFRYKLHADKIRQPAASDAIASAIVAATGQHLRIQTTTMSIEEFAALESASRPATGDAVADAALEVFGGSVVG